jgi:HK97 family phage major capsid protein
MNLHEQAERLEELRGEILTLAEAPELSDEDAERYAAINTEFDELRSAHDADYAAAVTYAAAIDEVRSYAGNPLNVEAGDGTRDAGFNVTRTATSDKFDLSEVRGLPVDSQRAELRSRAVDAVETAPDHMSDESREKATRLVERAGEAPLDERDQSAEIAEHILRTGSPDYHRAFGDFMRGDVTATSRFPNEARAAMSLTDGNGGFLVPFTLDPSIILTSTKSVNPVRRVSDTVTITTDTWNGVSSAGVTGEWLAEATEAADASPTFTQPSIPVHKGAAYVAASLEVTQDSNIANQLSGLLADAKDRLEGDSFVTGTGSGQPFGIVTALGLTTASRVAGSSGAAGAADLVVGDIYALDNALPDRYRDNSPAFIGHKSTWNKVRQFGTANNFHAFWTDLGGGRPAQLIGYDVHNASAMDSTIVSGSNDDVIVLGDFSEGYKVVDRVGTAIAYNPLVVGANQRPTGQVGWFMYFRVGADSVNDDAFRMLRL